MSEQVIHLARYRVTLDPRRLVAEIRGADDRLWFRLRLLASLDSTHGRDETLGEPEILWRDRQITISCASSCWTSKTIVLDCYDDRLEINTIIHGEGRLVDAHLLGGWRLPNGFLPSGSALRTVFSPNPDHPRRIARPAVEPAIIGVVGDGGEPGVGHWLFAPAPWCFAGCREQVPESGEIPTGDWVAFGLFASISQQTFTSLHYTGGTDGFSLRLEYEGHTVVTGEFRAPKIVIQFGANGPVAALRSHRDLLVAQGFAPEQRHQEKPSHWSQPLFCGWGAQRHLAGIDKGATSAFATQRHYDEFLRTLAEHDVVPGTVIIDDKWQRHYATNQPDEAKWPDLAGWITDRHTRGQRVLLWWKAWDPEGAPESACVRLPDGTPVAVDPETDAGRDLIADTVRFMLGPDGLNADGLKVDFLARTPSGMALRHAGPSWGAALLHELLRQVYTAAKRVKPDSLIVTHTPNPAFSDVVDMIRLNDIRMLDAIDPDGPIAEQMTYRAAVAKAACPDTLIDTDGWCLPNRAEWAEYSRLQPALGVPALYYATHIDHSGEPLRPADLAEIAEIWRNYRDANNLPAP